ARRDPHPVVEPSASGAHRAARADAQPRAFQPPLTGALQQHAHTAAALINAPRFHERPSLMELPEIADAGRQKRHAPRPETPAREMRDEGRLDRPLIHRFSKREVRNTFRVRAYSG